CRQATQCTYVGCDQLVGAAAFLGQGGGQPQQGDQLGGEGFGGGNANFRAGLGQQAPVGFAYEGAAGHVADGQGAQVTLGFGVAQGGQGVGSFPGLGDGDQQRVGGHGHLAIAELAGHFHLARQAGLLFNPVTRNHTGVVAGAAGHDMDVLDILQAGFRIWAQHGGQYMVVTQGAAQGVGDRRGLLMDFLEHVVAVFALVQAVRGVFVALRYVFHQLVLLVPDFATFLGQPGVVAFVQVDELVGDLQQGQGVGGDEVFFTALAYHQRAAHAGAVEGVGLVLMDNAQRIGAVQFCQGGTEGAEQVLLLLVVVRQQVGDYFGVGVGGEDVAEVGQLFAQDAVVLNDAVMHDGQALGDVRVGIALGGLAVGGPAGVGDAQVADGGGKFEGFFQFGDLAGGANALDAVAGGEDGDASGVIAALFEAAQAFYEDGGDVAFGDGAYY